MTSQSRKPLLVYVSACVAAMPAAVLAQGNEMIDGWTDILIVGSRLLIVGGGLLGIVYAAVSMGRAYNAPDDDARMRHMLAAIFSGVFTIIGVIIGWISGILFP